MLIDTHTHINFSPLLQDWENHLQSFQNAGGKILINAGAHQSYNENGIHIAQKAKTLFPDLIVKATIGIHPDDGKEIKKADFPSLSSLLETQYLENQEVVCAIGECGIDLHSAEATPLEHQYALLQLHCELARKLKLPIVIHSRDAFNETLKVLQNFRDLNIYFHCRGYGPSEIQEIEKLLPNLRIGFTNIITYKNAPATRDSLLAIKKAKILTETDAPRLPPQPFRGQTCYPHYVSYVTEKIAELLEKPQSEIEKIVRDNACSLLGINA